MDWIPGRVLRLGQEFDFVTVVNNPTPQAETETLGELFREEFQASKTIAAMLSGKKSGDKVKALHRSLITK